jgi:hypothetical protein
LARETPLEIQVPGLAFWHLPDRLSREESQNAKPGT